MLFRTAILALCALSPLAYSSPIQRRHHPDAVHVATSPARRDVSVNPFFSFNNWHGNQNLNNFDNFFGAGNFNGFNNQQIIVAQDKLVCSQRDIRVVQQKLSVLLELSKQVILSQVCDVVSQVLVFEQFFNGHRQFGRDISRKSGKNRFVGFDRDIASKFGNIFDEQGNLSFFDLGFDGFNIGHNFAQFNDNWNDAVSPGEIAALFQAIQQAVGFNFGGVGFKGFNGGFNNGGFNNGGFNNGGFNNGNGNNNGEVDNGEASSTVPLAESETASVAEPTESVAARRWW